MAIDIKSEDYDVLKQPYINKYLRVDLLDFDYNVIRDITGHLTKCSVSVDADSDLRRNCDVSMVITDDKVDISPEGGIWLNRYIQPYVGYENAYTGKIQWYNQGIFLINEPTWQYDSSTNELSFKGVDLMAKMTGLRNGNLEGIPTVVWLCPILPYINDTAENISSILDFCIDSGVKGIVCFEMGMTLRDGDRQYYYKKLDEHFPGLKEKYINEFGNNYSIPSPNNKQLMAIFNEKTNKHGILSKPDEVFKYISHFPQNSVQSRLI